MNYMGEAAGRPEPPHPSVTVSRPLPLHSRPGLFTAVVHQRCPRCRRGFVYRHGNSMNNLCPVCGLEFNREEGYYTGALFFGYVLATPTMLFYFFLFCLAFPDMDLVWAAVLSIVAFLPTVSLILRLSHVIWIGVDRAAPLLLSAPLPHGRDSPVTALSLRRASLWVAAAAAAPSPPAVTSRRWTSTPTRSPAARACARC